MRLPITGGRDFDDRTMLYMALDRLHAEYRLTILIHGDARGADRLGGEWAVERGVEVLACPADWKRHGRGAGPIRNRQMPDHKPDLLVAFPGGKGTADMVAVAKKAGLRVVIAERQVEIILGSLFRTLQPTARTVKTDGRGMLGSSAVEPFLVRFPQSAQVSNSDGLGGHERTP